MPAAKKKPASKRPKARGKTRGKSVAEEDRPVRSLEQVDEIVTLANEKAETWAEAWRMHVMGVPSRVIGQRMGVSHATALEWARSWERIVDGDPDRVSDRAWLVSRLDLMAEKMFGELTVLEAAENQKAEQARREEREYVKAPVWLANSDPLLKVLAQKARLVTPGDSGKKQVTVELGAAGAGLPGAVAGVLARVTIEDGDAA